MAISYYAIGLLSYAMAPVASGKGLDKGALIAVLTPLVVIVAWAGMRRVRQKLHRGEHGEM